MMEDEKQKLPFHYEAHFWGIVRIGFWCFAFLLLAGLCIPRPLPEDIPFTKATENSPVIPMVTISDDRRFIRADAPSDPSKLNILWISDSTGIIIPAEKNFQTATEAETKILPALVAKDLEKTYGFKNFNIRFYAQLGLRPLDNLIFSLEALRQKPDIIIMPMNYVYDFNPYKVMGKNAPLSLLPRNFITKPSLWPLIPILASPADNLLALVGSRLPIIRDATPFKRYIEQNYLASEKLLTSQKAQNHVRFDTPVNDVGFWVLRQLLHGDISQVLDTTGKPSQKILYERMIASNAPYTTHSFSTGSLNRIINYDRESNIPVMLYMVPLNTDYYQNPASAAAIKEVTKYLTTAAQVPGGKLHIIPEIPMNIRQTMTFRPTDGVHIVSPGRFDNYMAAQIWQMIEKNHLKKSKEK